MKSDRLNGRYRIEKVLGQGAFAEVFLCTDFYPKASGRFVSEEILNKLALIEE